MYHERQGADCILKAFSRFPLVFLMVVTMMMLKTFGTGQEMEEEEEESDETAEMEGSEESPTASASGATVSSSAQ